MNNLYKTRVLNLYRDEMKESFLISKKEYVLGEKEINNASYAQMNEAVSKLISQLVWSIGSRFAVQETFAFIHLYYHLENKFSYSALGTHLLFNGEGDDHITPLKHLVNMGSIIEPPEPGHFKYPTFFETAQKTPGQKSRSVFILVENGFQSDTFCAFENNVATLQQSAYYDLIMARKQYGDDVIFANISDNVRNALVKGT